MKEPAAMASISGQIGCQRSEVRCQREPEVRGLMSDVRKTRRDPSSLRYAAARRRQKKTDVGFPRSDVRSIRKKITIRYTVLGRQITATALDQAFGQAKSHGGIVGPLAGFGVERPAANVAICPCSEPDGFFSLQTPHLLRA